jgi:hypothetical protein
MTKKPKSEFIFKTKVIEYIEGGMFISPHLHEKPFKFVGEFYDFPEVIPPDPIKEKEMYEQCKERIDAYKKSSVNSKLCYYHPNYKEHYESALKEMENSME